jgi:hypothetical protein
MGAAASESRFLGVPAFGAEEAGGRGVVLGEASSLREEKEEGETRLGPGEKVFSP